MKYVVILIKKFPGLNSVYKKVMNKRFPRIQKLKFKETSKSQSSSNIDTKILAKGYCRNFYGANFNDISRLSIKFVY